MGGPHFWVGAYAPCIHTAQRTPHQAVSEEIRPGARAVMCSMLTSRLVGPHALHLTSRNAPQHQLQTTLTLYLPLAYQSPTHYVVHNPDPVRQQKYSVLLNPGHPFACINTASLTAARLLTWPVLTYFPAVRQQVSTLPQPGLDCADP